jgi:hypothetical protein
MARISFSCDNKQGIPTAGFFIPGINGKAHSCHSLRTTSFNSSESLPDDASEGSASRSSQSSSSSRNSSPPRRRRKLSQKDSSFEKMMIELKKDRIDADNNRCEALRAKRSYDRAKSDSDVAQSKRLVAAALEHYGGPSR